MEDIERTMRRNIKTIEALYLSRSWDRYASRKSKATSAAQDVHLNAAPTVVLVEEETRAEMATTTAATLADFVCVSKRLQETSSAAFRDVEDNVHVVEQGGTRGGVFKMLRNLRTGLGTTQL